MNNSASGPKSTKRSSKRKVERKDPKLKSTIVCKCGVQILLVPDVKEMNLALEEHVKEHKKNYKISDAEAILDDLIAQVFSKIGQED
jgi:hypothetical protein